MPKRVISEKICFDEHIQKLNYFTEVFLYRLIANCDDFGRFDARPDVLMSQLFPLQKNFIVELVLNAIESLVDEKIAKLYEVDGKQYIRILDFDKYCSRKARKESFPADPEEVHIDYGDTSKNQESYVIMLPLTGFGSFGITDDMVKEWSNLYPAVDVLQELRNMRGWLLANTSKRKTKSGILRFVNTWLSKQQNRWNTSWTYNNQKDDKSYYDDVIV